MNHTIKSAYNLFRNRVTREVRKSKRVYYQQFFATNFDNMKNTWKGIKNILNMNNKNGRHICQLKSEGKHIKSNEGMANALNDFFPKIGPVLDNEIPGKPMDPKMYLKNKIGFLDFQMLYLGGGGGVDTNLDVPPPILIFHN